MKRLAVAFVSIGLLSGCLGKLERLTEETKDRVTDNLHTLQGVEGLQATAGGLALLNDTTASAQHRYNAALQLFLKTPDADVHRYVGAMMPLMDFVDVKTFGIPNVTIVGEQADPRLMGMTPINHNTYNILEATVIRILTALSGQFNSQLKPANRQDPAEVLKVATRMMYVTPSVMGALEVDDQFRISAAPIRLKDYDHSKTEPHTLLRICAAKMLLGIESALGSSLSEDARTRMATGMETMMQVTMQDIALCNEESMKLIRAAAGVPEEQIEN